MVKAAFKKTLCQLAFLSLGLTVLSAPSQAEDLPEISPSLKKMLGGLPINDLKDDVQKMAGALKKTSCGNGLKGCYSAKSGDLQLYFFTSNSVQQTFLLVLNKKMALPHLLKANVQKILGGSSLQDPIISISTTDYNLDVMQMPPDLQKIVANSYFNVNSLAFSSGVQLAARANIQGAMKLAMQSMGIQSDQLTMRAAVVMPIPTDIAGGAGAGAGLADSMAHSKTMTQSVADAAKPEAFVEFQFAPNAVIQMAAPSMKLTDATVFIDNSLVFGYKGNASFSGSSKKTLLQFQTPLTPEGAIEFADFSFRMASPATYTLEDLVAMMTGMAVPDPRLVKYGGGFIRNIASIQKPLLAAVKPLSVFQVRNPVPPSEYKFGDRTKPFPEDPKYFNVILAGPLADGGPMLKYTAGATILGQNFGSIDVFADARGFNGKASSDLYVKLGPLGKVTIQKIVAEASITAAQQLIHLKGNYLGQTVEVTLDATTLSIAVNASCVNPFEIKAKMTFDASTNLATVFDGQGGANVDPSKIQGCVGAELQAAYNKIANEYKNLSGYTAGEANAALKKISDDAAAAAAAAKAAADAAAAKAAADAAAAQAAAYKAAKDQARNLANSSTSAGKNAFNQAGNEVSKLFGTKKKKNNDANDIFDPTVFDWEYYYDTKGMAWGNTDLFDYWRNVGYYGGERASRVFWMQEYRRLTGNYKSSDKDMLNYWLKDGINRGFPAAPDWTLDGYKARNPDLNGMSFRDLMSHWLDYGRYEGRDGRP